jgi:hypothetical protein
MAAKVNLPAGLCPTVHVRDDVKIRFSHKGIDSSCHVLPVGMLIVVHGDDAVWSKVGGCESQVVERDIERVASVNMRESQIYSVKVEFVAA